MAGQLEEDEEAADEAAEAVIEEAEITGIRTNRTSSNSSNSSSPRLQACRRCQLEVPFRSSRLSLSLNKRQVKAQLSPLDVSPRLQRLRSKRREEADGSSTHGGPINSYETPSREAPIILLPLIHVT